MLADASWCLPSQFIDTIVDDPLTYLHEPILLLLRKQPIHRDQLVEVYVKCKTGHNCGFSSFINLLEHFEKAPVFIDLVREGLQKETDKKGLHELIVNLESVKGLEVFEVQGLIQKHGVFKLSRRFAIEADERRALSAQKQEQVN